MLSPTMRITGAAACAKTTEQKSAAASAVKERRTDRNEDDEFMATCHCRGAFRGAQRRVAEYNAPPPDRSARHFRVARPRAELALTTRRPQLHSRRAAEALS